MAQAGQQAVTAAGLLTPASVSASSSSAAQPLPSSARTPGTSSPAGSAGFAFPHYYYFPPMFTLQPNLATRRAQMDKWTALVLAYCRHYRIFRLVLGEPASGSESRDGPVRIDGGADGDAAAAAAAAAGAGDSSAAPTANNNHNDDDDDDDDGPRSVPYYAPDLFRNRQIDRALTPAAAREVLEAMRQEGRAEWVGTGEGGNSSSNGPPASSETASAYIYWKTPEEWAALVDAWIDDTAQRGSVLTLYELTAGDATRGTELHGLDPVVLQRALAVLVKRGRAQVFGSAGSLGVKFF